MAKQKIAPLAHAIETDEKEKNHKQTAKNQEVFLTTTHAIKAKAIIEVFRKSRGGIDFSRTHKYISGRTTHRAAPISRQGFKGGSGRNLTPLISLAGDVDVSTGATFVVGGGQLRQGLFWGTFSHCRYGGNVEAIFVTNYDI